MNPEASIRTISTAGLPDDGNQLCPYGRHAWRISYRGSEQLNEKIRAWAWDATNLFPAIENDIYECENQSASFSFAHSLEHFVVTTLMMQGKIPEHITNVTACTIPGVNSAGEDIAVFWLRDSVGVSAQEVENILLGFFEWLGIPAGKNAVREHVSG